MNWTKASRRLTVKRWLPKWLGVSGTKRVSPPTKNYSLNERLSSTMKKATVTPGVLVEHVGDDLMVIVPGNSDVISLSGRPAAVLVDVQAGREVDPSEPALKALSDLGIVTSPGMSRRGLIKAGAIGAGAGIAVLAMPNVAAASSGGVPVELVKETTEGFLVFLPGWDGQGSESGIIISAFVWLDDEPQGDKKAVWEITGSGLGFPGGVATQALVFRYNGAPNNISEVRLTFDFQGQRYVAVYIA
jgi:hypothetical protein